MSKRNYFGTRTDFYAADAETAEIVNLALTLQRPLLVEGEPGCGKTRLADSVTTELGMNPATELVRVTVKSTSSAKDLLYRFDGLKRLHDAQIKDHPDARFIHPYISLGPLGAALHSNALSVVLLDEIDKADMDFPNDLLEVLDTFSFTIDDLPLEEEDECKKRHGFGRRIVSKADNRPIVIITSNREKPLPDAFLRRCLYVRLTFPEVDAQLADIVRKNTKLTQQELGEEILKVAVSHFREIRNLALDNEAQKPPTTSELIDWVRILHDKGQMDGVKKGGWLPAYWRVLFKTFRDLDTYEAAAKRQKGPPNAG